MHKFTGIEIEVNLLYEVRLKLGLFDRNLDEIEVA